jgi:hypothetical protein
MSRIVVEFAEDWAEKLRTAPPSLALRGFEDALEMLGRQAGDPGVLRLRDVFTQFVTKADQRVGLPSGPLLPDDPAPARRKSLRTGPGSVGVRPTPPGDFAGFFAIDVAGLPEQDQDELLAELRSAPHVIAGAAFESTYRGAASRKATASRRKDQFYLRATGVGAPVEPHGWHGLGLAHLDVGWLLDHQALSGFPPPTCFPNGNPPSDSHGTMSLGVVVGGDEMQGIAKGATPKALIFNVKDRSIAGPLREFLYSEKYDSLLYGDVLLIEIEHDDTRRVQGGRPLELAREAFLAIQYAVSEGIAVIEPAGNGHDVDGRHEGWDLDAIRDDPDAAPAWNKRWRGTRESDIPDSGAIMVSGAMMLPNPPAPVTAYTTRRDLNNGSRVDCFGWGAGVLTAGEIGQYTDLFDKTSAASAMVAGIALQVQRMAMDPKVHGHVLSPLQLREVLRHPRSGTRVRGNGSRTRVVPHLGKIREVLRRLPRLTVRAYQGDDGGVRDVGAVQRLHSPDIVLVRGGQSGADSDHSMPVREAKHLLVRAANRGRGAAVDTTVTAYWCTHDEDPYADWHELGESDRVDLPAGGEPKWLASIELPADLPRDRAIDILVVVGARLDPAPILPPVRHLHHEILRDDMIGFVTSNANTAIRTFPVA